MRSFAIVFLLAVFVPSPQIQYFRFERPVQVTSSASGQTCFVVDPAIFAHAALQLADLRLYRGALETPYVLRAAAPAQSAEQPVTLLNLGRRGGRTAFDAAMPAGNYSDIALAVSGHDFIATVTVSGGQTPAETAATRLGSYTIFDLTGQKLGRSTVLHLPQSSFPYLHFSIAGPIAPDSVTGLSVPRQPVSQPKYVDVARSTVVVQRGHSSVMEFTVPAHMPIDRIVFAPGRRPASFSRNVSVVAVPDITRSTDRPELQSRTSFGNLLRVHGTRDGRRIDEERLDIDVPDRDFDAPSKWTITIENGDDRPIQLKSVTLQMQERTLCFDAVEGAAYTLYYGDAALAAPRYDYATLFAPQPNAAQATLGPERHNPVFKPRPDTRPFTEKHPVLLWVVLALVIALLAAIAFRSVKLTSRPPA